MDLSQTGETCWTGTFKALHFGNTCIQKNPHKYSEIIGSEDCLYPNVWTPTLNASANLVVMLRIHGGNLEFSSGNWPTYSANAQFTNSTNVVDVSMNYRLHALGFMALNILSERSANKTSGNFGFMGQQLALKWIHRNIPNFGGNPNIVSDIKMSSQQGFDTHITNRTSNGIGKE